MAPRRTSNSGPKYECVVHEASVVLRPAIVSNQNSDERAANERYAGGALKSTKLAAGVVAVIATVTAAIVWLNWPWLELAVGVEQAPIAWLQSTVLAASAVACLAHAATRSRGTLGWSLAAVGLFTLALDERFMGHERLKEWIWLEIFDGDADRLWIWGDAPMLVNGAIAAAAAVWIARETRSVIAVIWLGIAATFGAIAVAMDLATTSIVVQVWEELIELTAESCFLVAVLVSLPGSQ